MRRLTSILLLLILVSGSIGIQLVFNSRKIAIRSEMKKLIKNGVPEDELFAFEFKSNETPDWTRIEKEFRIDNHLYDVVSKEESAGKIIYSCVSDDQETFLFANLGEQVSKLAGDNKTPAGKVITAFLQIQTINDFKSPEPVLKSIGNDQENYFQYSFFIKSFDLEGTGEPPEIC